jgi:hypothetical protein
MKNEEKKFPEKKNYVAPDAEVMMVASKLNILDASLPGMGGEEW